MLSGEIFGQLDEVLPKGLKERCSKFFNFCMINPLPALQRK
jgi:hypothetical protein